MTWLEEAEGRCERAREAPWSARWLPEGMPAEPCRFGVIGPDGKEVARCWDEQEARWMESARTDLPRALAEIRDLREKLDVALAENETLSELLTEARAERDELRRERVSK